MNPYPPCSTEAQLEVWSSWGDASRLGFAGRYTEAAATIAAANAAEDRFLWGPGKTSDHLDALARDLRRLELGADPIECDSIELCEWILHRVASVADERSRGWDVPGWYLPPPSRRQRARKWLRRLRHARLVW